MGTDGRARSSKAGAGIRVLLVDDEETFRTTMAKLLTRRGFDVRTACDGAEGLEALGAEDFDVMVLDLKMPVKDGLETLREARRLRPATQVVMLTGHGTVATGIDAMTAEAVDFLQKPAVIDDLVSVLVAAAQHRKESR